MEMKGEREEGCIVLTLFRTMCVRVCVCARALTRTAVVFVRLGVC